MKQEPQVDLCDTRASRGPAVALVAAFVAIIFGIPALDQTSEVMIGLREGWQRSHTVVQEVGDLLEPVDWLFDREQRREHPPASVNREIGRRIKAMEDSLIERSVLSRTVVPQLRHFMVGCLGASTEEVYRGRGRWLFLRAGVDSLTGPGFFEHSALRGKTVLGSKVVKRRHSDPRPAIGDFAALLHERGISLLLVPIPSKASIHPEQLSRFAVAEPHLRNSSLLQLIDEIEQMGVEVYDPLPDLLCAVRSRGIEAYLERDTHWSPQGLAVVATGIARRLVERGWLPPQSARLADFGRQGLPVSGVGDLSQMLMVPAPSPWFPMQEITIQQVAASDDRPWAADRNATVLLLGDSFANVFHLEDLGWGAHGGLPEQLSFELQRSVDLIAINGDGAYASRRELFQMMRWGDDRLVGKVVVIWTFAERELVVGDWRQLPDVELPRG